MHKTQKQQQTAENPVRGQRVRLQIPEKRQIMLDAGMPPCIVIQIVQIIPDKSLKMKEKRVVAEVSASTIQSRKKR